MNESQVKTGESARYARTTSEEGYIAVAWNALLQEEKALDIDYHTREISVSGGALDRASCLSYDPNPENVERLVELVQDLSSDLRTCMSFMNNYAAEYRDAKKTIRRAYIQASTGTKAEWIDEMLDEKRE